MTEVSAQTILPGATIGILGGGQLGRMLVLAGRNMGYRFVTLDPTENSPCGQVADSQLVANYDDLEAAQQLIQLCDVITYEFENVDIQVTNMLREQAYVPQGTELLYVTQHRIREKQALVDAGVKVAPYVQIHNLHQLQAEIAHMGLPCVLKTVTGGYDGKGQTVIHSLQDLESIWESYSPWKLELVLEKFIQLDKELSVIVARNMNGQVKAFPPAENKHVSNILHTSIVPARVSTDIQQEAINIALHIAESFQIVGLLAVEFFLSREGQLYVNELAPRPHNSGHYTMEACKTSQFEQHLRAICNLPLGSTELMSSVVMVNVLGEHIQPLMQWMQNEDSEQHDIGVSAKLHVYGKHEVKEKRKMGHVNVLTTHIDSALAWIDRSAIWRNEQGYEQMKNS